MMAASCNLLAARPLSLCSWLDPKPSTRLVTANPIDQLLSAGALRRGRWAVLTDAPGIANLLNRPEYSNQLKPTSVWEIEARILGGSLLVAECPHTGQVLATAGCDVFAGEQGRGRKETLLRDQFQCWGKDAFQNLEEAGWYHPTSMQTSKKGTFVPDQGPTFQKLLETVHTSQLGDGPLSGAFTMIYNSSCVVLPQLVGTPQAARLVRQNLNFTTDKVISTLTSASGPHDVTHPYDVTCTASSYRQPVYFVIVSAAAEANRDKLFHLHASAIPPFLDKVRKALGVTTNPLDSEEVLPPIPCAILRHTMPKTDVPAFAFFSYVALDPIDHKRLVRALGSPISSQLVSVAP
ncbi:hypothetical protein KFL_002530090 [Klebsormidium nitens]|uniref:Uncharacterized protein n=1 Tax=Klebsormidium nitens TaxID=105231 RepID=A0A1Y1I497_KLENI|nr:hypothetical protein KFL_002530090 [Klebsormidium nitens]|eukprot:GAQ85764.1 hypothetical protein KFL_002530090 [Klebsormidium nitens]